LEKPCANIAFKSQLQKIFKSSEKLNSISSIQQYKGEKVTLTMTFMMHELIPAAARKKKMQK